MRVLALTLAGPTIWAAIFSAVYALHGVGCAMGWTEIDLVIGSLHRMAMASAWLVGILASVALLVHLPSGPALPHWLPRAGAWVGIGATLFTLFPILVTSSCGS